MPLLRYKRCFGFLNSQQKSCHFFVKSYMGSPEETHSSPPAEHHGVSLQEWQAWGTTSPVPSMVNQIIRDLKMLEMETDSHITFGGNHGTLSGDFKVQEDKKHRAKYASLADSEEKLQFFSARQIACRLLGSRGYLCQKCWLASEDCMCSRVATCLLAKQLHIWLYMHPKDFLRQNNTGKLLWQVFGIHAATLCLFGITEHEEKMWNVFQLEGRNKVWCLYPNKNAPTFSVTDIISHSRDLERQENGEDTMNFILIDGTWNNSNAMFRRLQVLDLGKTIGNAKECSGLYLLEANNSSKGKGPNSSCLVSVSQDQTSIFQKKENDIMLWHYRLGHPNFMYLKKLFPSLFINKNSNEFTCEICQFAKHVRNSYQALPYKESQPFALIHSDVWGPSKVKNITGSRAS
ncbi:uncharacterized protein [Henckelia pumila]|uniref:uncharacterized protein isoform X2 n=1 Tax=Henckelia pumila TaxID=405737 RepID=UPI003C6E3B0A